MSVEQHEVQIDTTRKVRALTSPLRRRFVDVLSQRGPASVREVAAEMDRPPATLYYHLRQLEDAGLVRAVGERATGKRPETLYELVSDHFRIAKSSEDESWQAELERYVRVHLRDVERAIAVHVEDPGFDRESAAPLMHFRSIQLRMGEKDREAFKAKLEALTAFLIEADGRAGDDDPNLSVALAMAPLED